MLVMRHFISSRRTAILATLCLVGVGGCTGGQLLSLRPSVEPAAGEIVSTTAPVAAVTQVKNLPLKPSVEPVSDIQKIEPVSDEVRERKSSWCQALREGAAADATILRSPTLLGSIDDSGKASLNLGLSYSSFKKANLMQQAAEVRCRKYLAETGLQVLVFVSPQNLTAAGYRAKYDKINEQNKELKKLRLSIAKALKAGDIDREKATSIAVLMDRLLAEGDSSKSQADRRISERLLDGKSTNALAHDLLLAEAELDKINSEISTANAMDVSAKVGWGDNVSTNGLDVSDQSFNGKVSFSIQLGALNPQRFEHERLATEAKQRAIKLEEGGAIWQVGVLRRAHERAIAGLEESQKKIEDAISKAKHLLAVLNSEPLPDFEGARLNARFEIIKLYADRAGVVGSLSEIRTNLNRLQNG
jgi:hypothetical protein